MFWRLIIPTARGQTRQGRDSCSGLTQLVRSSLKNGFENDCSKFSRSKRSVVKLCLLLCCLRDGENNLPSTQFKIYTKFNKKCACTKETAARDLCNDRLGVLCKGLSLNCFYRSFVVKPIVPKSFSFEKPNKTFLCFEVLFKVLC